MIPASHPKPPEWPLRILRFFVKKEYLEEIEGDMEEIFHDHADVHGYKAARRFYAWEMLKLLRPVLMKNLSSFHNLNQPAMFRNYFKVSVRGLMKHPLNSFINVFGLAVAIGVCVMAYGFARWAHNTDQFHINKERVHLVTFFANRDGKLQEFGQTPRPLGAMMKEDFAGIERACRVEDRNVIVKYRDNVFHERIRQTDPAFLEMFTFPLKWGSAEGLADLNSVILSEEMSDKYFGEDNPVGRDLLIRFDELTSKPFKVAGVAAKFPEAHTIEFDFLVNFENTRVGREYDQHDWNAFVNATFIEASPEKLSTIAARMEKYRSVQNKAAGEDWAIDSFAFRPLASLHRHASQIRDDISRSTDSEHESIGFLAVISIFMLALACFNYINIAIATAARRLKEIGVRKTIGASRWVVIVQFLTENIVITFFALVVGIALGAFVFIPWLENTNNFDIGFTLNDHRIWMYLPAVLLATGIASGIYPALYVSAFHVVGILKGAVKFGNRNPVTKVFLGVQLILACILITTGVMFRQNTDYMSKRSWGYDQRHTLYAALPDSVAFDRIAARVSSDSRVKSISGAKHHLGKTHSRSVLHFPDRQVEAEHMEVEENYFTTMGLELVAGRGFAKDSESDRRSVVVNETFVKNILADPVGYSFRMDSVRYEIVGVVRDFHSYNFFRLVNPVIFTVADKSDFRYIALRVDKGAELETAKVLQAAWSSTYPETPFDGGFQEDTWGDYFEKLAIHASVWKGFATIAILLASLGLYGLVTLNVSGRAREFSIRKILGAGLSNIAGNIGNQYLVLFAVALVIGAPVSFMMNKMLFDLIYNYHMPITYSGVLIAIVILIFVLLLTVSTQVKKVLKANPVEGLKAE